MSHAYAPLEAEQLRHAFAALDRILTRPITLIVGGGTAMLLAYRIPVRTTDVDAYPREAPLEEIRAEILAVARAHGLAPDWINPHFETFAFVLPPDYGTRLKPIHEGERLKVMALGVEDLLVMKCFAGREKDVGHARALLKRGPDLAVVEGRIQALVEKGVRGAQDALDFLDDLGGGA
jgi:predicted nucleotidyltransferase